MEHFVLILGDNVKGKNGIFEITSILSGEGKSRIKELEQILNDIWCTYSFEKGYGRWMKIREEIEQPYRQRIETELQHVRLGHGIEEARLAVKDEMQKFIRR